jgi:hypothetical protein
MKRISMVALLVGGCASAHPPPSAQMASATEAVKHAEQLAGNAQGAAEGHARLARGELGEAQRRAKERDYEGAEAYAVRARQDAELSSTLARSTYARRRTVELADTARDLELHARAREPVGEGAEQPPAIPASRPTVE